MAERKLRVLSIAHTAVSRPAGRLRYHPLARDTTLDVHLVVPERWHQFGRWSDADAPCDPGVTVHVEPIRWPAAGPASWYLHHYKRLGRLARALRPDVVHLWEEPWSVVSFQGARLAHTLGAALVLEVDQNILKRLPPPFQQIRRHTLRRAATVLARSPDAADVVRACGFSGAVLPIGYGVDQQVFRPGEPPPAGGLQLGYVGRIVAEKGLDDVVAAMASAPEAVRLAIMGEGPHEAALRAHVARAGLGERVSFQPWSDPAGVAGFLRACHVAILPTRLTPIVKEQFGRVIIEAQACGTPVIGAATGAIPEIVGDGGWIVPERDPASQARLFAHLLADPAEIARRRTLGLANVAARFSFAAVARDLSAGWRQAAAGRR